MAEYRERLRRLALGDEQFIESVHAMGSDSVEASRLDPKTHALVRLAALLGAGGPAPCCHHAVAVALAAGATPDEVVGTLIALAPTIGFARVVAAAPECALAIGYDIDTALESRNGNP